jgi:peptidoglycan/xylan/chitin deacetylase (PgdA/CDA1 family)
MRKKEILARMISWIFPHSILIRLRCMLKKEIVVLAYHRICDVEEKKYRHDLELISGSKEQFEYQVKHIRKYFNPITLEQFERYIEGKEDLPKRPLLITFDDGFDDNYFNAYPILKKYSVPATIFISTGYISTNKTIWFDFLASLVITTKSNKLDLHEINKSYDLGNDIKLRGSIMEDICEDLKAIPDKTRLEILERLEKDYSNDLKTVEHSMSAMLSWEQVDEMSKGCISFGAHTVNHPVLSMLSAEDLEYELNESKRVLDLKLGKEIKTISYPVGTTEAYNKDVLKAVKKAGYITGFTYIPGNNPLPIHNNYAIKRLHVERYTSNQCFTSMLVFPRLFSDS